jgi:hypothetical protein
MLIPIGSLTPLAPPAPAQHNSSQRSAVRHAARSTSNTPPLLALRTDRDKSKAKNRNANPAIIVDLIKNLCSENPVGKTSDSREKSINSRFLPDTPSSFLKSHPLFLPRVIPLLRGLRWVWVREIVWVWVREIVGVEVDELQ